MELTEHPSFGFSRAVGDFFQIEAGQELSLDSKRSISGDLELTEPDGGPVISVLSIAKGKVNKTFTKLKLKRHDRGRGRAGRGEAQGRATARRASPC